MLIEKYRLFRVMHRLLVALVFSLLFPHAGLGEESVCDQELLQPKKNPLGYRLRGERCEGQYIEQVASTALSVASLTKTFEDYDLNSDKPLQIEWPKLGDQEIRLRAHGIKWKLYYRMDTTRPSESTAFQWPVGILSALNIPKNSIGIVGWTYQKFEDTTKKVYLPLRVIQSQGANVQSSYRLLLWPGVQLKEVYVSLAKVDDQGKTKEFLLEGMPLGLFFYPAQREIPVNLQGFQETGIYKVDISATLQSGSDTSLSMFLYHSVE